MTDTNEKKSNSNIPSILLIGLGVLIIGYFLCLDLTVQRMSSQSVSVWKGVYLIGTAFCFLGFWLRHLFAFSQKSPDRKPEKTEYSNNDRGKKRKQRADDRQARTRADIRKRGGRQPQSQGEHEGNWCEALQEFEFHYG